MRYLLIPVVVLAVTPFTYAGLVLSVDGDTTLTSHFMIAPDTVVSIGIWVQGADSPTVNPDTGMPVDGSTLLAGGDLKIAIRNAAGGTLDVSSVTFPGSHPTIENAPKTVLFNTSTGKFSVGLALWEYGYSVYESSSSYMSITGGNIFSNTIGNYFLQDDLMLTYGVGFYYLDLIAASDILYYDWVVGELSTCFTAEVDSIHTLYSQGTVIDTIYVVPEPMTLVLLGLGGLMLRRKRTG